MRVVMSEFYWDKLHWVRAQPIRQEGLVGLSVNLGYCLNFWVKVSIYHRHQFHSDIVCRAVWLYYGVDDRTWY